MEMGIPIYDLILLVFQVITFILYFGIAIIMFFNIGSKETNPPYSSFPTHFMANCISDFIIFILLELLVRCPRYGFLIEYYLKHDWVAFGYDGFIYSSVLLSIFSNFIIVMNRYFSLVHGIKYKTKWNSKVSCIIIVVQFALAFMLFFHTYFFDAPFGLSADGTYYSFQVTNWSITKVDRSIMIIVSILIIMAICVLNCLIFHNLKLPKFATAKTSAARKRNSFIIYSIAVLISLFFILGQQVMQLYAVSNFDANLKYRMTLALSYIIPASISFHPYLMLYVNLDIRNMIMCMAGNFKTRTENRTISDRGLATRTVIIR
uniref:G_PROTEIN_RECEP_F1_2 domain-containing protein n=1 Tax=Rhabditophanes sp. KR3021 TaxID=114890 RepID=A0AC35TPH7_9BILA